MAVFKRYLIRVLALSFGCFLKKYNGLLGIKEKINKLSNGIYKEILIYVFNNKLKKSGSWIGYRSKLGKNLVFPHDITGIFISQGAEIENNCVIFQQVTIGSNTLNDSKGNGSPIIGDNCYIGAGAKIIGGIIIGNNCRIGANCVVVKDMPDNTVAVLQPTRIIPKENLNNKFIPIENNKFEK